MEQQEIASVIREYQGKGGEREREREREREGRENERSTPDMHNANDMHVKWQNKLTVTEQWNSQRQRALLEQLLEPPSVHFHGKKPFRVCSVQLKLYLQEIADITV